MPRRPVLKLIFAGIALFILVPLLGIRNPFLLELGFQICVFATLALGLNIVVGLCRFARPGLHRLLRRGVLSVGLSSAHNKSITSGPSPVWVRRMKAFPLPPICFGSS